MHNLFSACARVLSSFGDMLAFAAPAKKYPTVSAEEINAAAWGATGHAMRQAMRTVDEQLTSEQRQHLV